MRSLLLAVICYAFSIGIVAAAQSRSSKPDCVDKCWVNTQYVSSCNGDTDCLCSDADFQNAVYQCLYSQCYTAQFGAALHHALGLCANKEKTFVQSSTMMPPAILRQDGHKKKRQAVQQTASVSGYNPTSTPRPQSVSVSNYMTSTASRASPTARGSPTVRGSPTARGSPTSRGSPTGSPGPKGSPGARVRRPFSSHTSGQRKGDGRLIMRDFVDSLFGFNR